MRKNGVYTFVYCFGIKTESAPAPCAPRVTVAHSSPGFGHTKRACMEVSVRAYIEQFGGTLAQNAKQLRGVSPSAPIKALTEVRAFLFLAANVNRK